MPYVVINTSNMYDPENNVRYSTFEKADAKARETLSKFPASKLSVAEVLAEYSAVVDVTSAAPDPVVDDEPMPEEEEPMQ